MYAIIKSGSRQYQVRPESVITVNHLPLEQGAAFETEQVLLLEQDGGAVQIGTPYVAGAVVKGRVLSQERGRKVLVFKAKRRKNYRRTRGHRQELTQVRIESIALGGKVIAEAKPLEAKPAKAPRKPAAEAAPAGEAAKPAAKAKAPAKKAAAKKPAAKAPSKKAAGKTAGRSAAKAAAKKAAGKTAAKAPARKAAGKTPAKRGGKDKSGKK